MILFNVFSFPISMTEKKKKKHSTEFSVVSIRILGHMHGQQKDYKRIQFF